MNSLHDSPATIHHLTVLDATRLLEVALRRKKYGQALMSMVTTQATVRRGGERQRVPSTELVPGDVVMLEAGDRVPADLRLFQVKGLRVLDESALADRTTVFARVAPRAEAPLGARLASTGPHRRHDWGWRE